jgi:hypothetical protein
MTDLVARVTAAIQQVRDRTAHALRCDLLKAPSVWAVIGREHDAKPEWVVVGCSCDWQARVDARLAACVEASWGAVDVQARADESFDTVDEAGLAAFLAAAAQKETAK